MGEHILWEVSNQDFKPFGLIHFFLSLFLSHKILFSPTSRSKIYFLVFKFQIRWVVHVDSQHVFCTYKFEICLLKHILYIIFSLHQVYSLTYWKVRSNANGLGQVCSLGLNNWSWKDFNLGGRQIHRQVFLGVPPLPSLTFQGYLSSSPRNGHSSLP